MSIGLNRFWSSRGRRRFLSIGLIGLTTITIIKVRKRYNDLIELDEDEDDEFVKHTNREHKKSFYHGMHHPFLTNDIEQLNLFKKYYSKYDFLIGNNLNEIKEKHSLKTPVKFRSIKEYKNEIIHENISTLCVGGAPALIAAVDLISNKNKNENENEKDLIYLNDFRRIPIANGSAWHLEQDAHTEAPTNYKPTKFLSDQLKRIFYDNIYLKDICQTGEFPWRTIDWLSWIYHPSHWYRALKLSIQFQIFTMFNDRTNLLNDVSKQCFRNELFFSKLNQILNNKLLLQESGSIIIARNQQEINDLNQLKDNLIKEGRNLNILSKETLFQRYSFIPNGLMFAEKIHDRVLVANFQEILNNYLIEKGAKVLDGTLDTIYIDEKQSTDGGGGGGIASIKYGNGQEKFIKFSRLILSLGNQEIFTENNKRLFDVVSARGVSMLAFIYLPKHYKIPPVLVCGGTNHVTNLSPQPIQIDQNTNLFLMRFTAGACITPNISNKYTSFYDSTVAVGLLKSVKNTFPTNTKIKPIFIYGCNRQVSQYGQINWIQPYKNIFIQYGAAGGGLTRAPDFITNFNK
ncbi:unnamed protein product [Adineta steineri]|uniref:Uncharacterized protein n=1 Tax=Adineta steineri TaxID=433720 RepID=A0A818I512_9BILA|nr:unnamed protein product [Adineta steineri]CAF3519059.1 unnamed protein product [Adineta steineri]